MFIYLYEIYSRGCPIFLPLNMSLTNIYSFTNSLFTQICIHAERVTHACIHTRTHIRSTGLLRSLRRRFIVHLDSDTVQILMNCLCRHATNKSQTMQNIWSELHCIPHRLRNKPKHLYHATLSVHWTPLLILGWGSPTMLLFFTSAKVCDLLENWLAVERSRCYWQW